MLTILRILLVLTVWTLILTVFIYLLDLIVKFGIIDPILLKSIIRHVPAVVGRRVLHYVVSLRGSRVILIVLSQDIFNFIIRWFQGIWGFAGRLFLASEIERHIEWVLFFYGILVLLLEGLVTYCAVLWNIIIFSRFLFAVACEVTSIEDLVNNVVKIIALIISWKVRILIFVII